ncbi:transcription factor HES-5-like [Amia ocellicauda]|uniref:transcription factor HES-5-like n=1 Tax=Amia ocellicauda TaxID=2972642 RepID=UPI003464CB50
MAPTLAAAMGYSKEHATLSHKLRKPMVERMRRDRINSSIEQLKSLLAGDFLSQQPDSKLEKADILEMTVCYLRQRCQQQLASASSGPAAAGEGYSRCAQEIVRFLSRDQVKTESRRRLLSHFRSGQQSSDKASCPSALPQLSSPARHSTIKQESPAKGALWRPW